MRGAGGGGLHGVMDPGKQVMAGYNPPFTTSVCPLT